jgi:MIP family channel proteins
MPGSPSYSSFPCSNCKKECFAELLGTYTLVLIGPASVILLSFVSLARFDALALVALAFGGTVALMILVLGKQSGSVINPALTLAVASAKLLRRDLIVPYIFFQLVGGILAGLTLRFVFLSSINTTELGSTKLASGINPVAGIVLESVGTFILASSALVASTRIKKTKYQALFVGTTLSMLILFIGPLTGAGFNPARSLGPSLSSGYFTNLYVYFIGPVLGALAAGLVFRMVRDYGKRPPKGNLVCLC